MSLPEKSGEPVMKKGKLLRLPKLKMHAHSHGRHRARTVGVGQYSRSISAGPRRSPLAVFLEAHAEPEHVATMEDIVRELGLN